MKNLPTVFKTIAWIFVVGLFITGIYLDSQPVKDVTTDQKKTPVYVPKKVLTATSTATSTLATSTATTSTSTTATSTSGTSTNSL